MKTKDIETERLILRSMTLDDADFAAKLWGDPENGKYLADQPYKNGDELRKVIYDIDEWVDEYPFIAVCKNTGEPVATCCLGTEGPKDHWGFGYTVKKDLWGQGLATEMAKALINFAYSLGVRNFYCTVAKENKASCRVMEKCGLKIKETKAFKKRGTDMEFESNIYTMSME